MQDAINAKNAGSFEKAKTVQAAQTSGADDLTNTTVKAQKSMEGLNIEIQKLGFTFLPKAADAVALMTGAMEKFVKYVNKTLGAALDEDDRKAREAAAASGSTADMLNQGAEAQLTPAEQKKYNVSATGQPAGGAGGGGSGGGGSGGGSAEPGANETPVGSGGGKGGPELTTISSKSGKSTQVGKEYGSAFQKLIDYLDGTGYEINSLGGFVDRDVRGKPGQKSVHSMGGAIDINPEANPMGTELITDMPAEIAKVAASLGLGWGGNWKSKKDAMHFSAAKSEGGSMLSAANGAILSGPMSGYRPNLTMHGTEAIVPLNSSTADAAGLGTDPGVMMAQLEKMDEMISVLKSQLGVSEKLLRYQS
jgi:D-alanyl-D-alanine carboxypeptidase